MTKIQMQIVINHHELRIRELEKNICIYAREELGEMDFDSDKEALKYFSDFAAKHN